MKPSDSDSDNSLDNFYSPAWEKDFFRKDEIIRSRYNPIPTRDFYNFVSNGNMVYWQVFLEKKRKAGGTYKTYSRFETVTALFEEYETVGLYLQSYYNGKVKQNFIDLIFGFAIDLDKVRSHELPIVFDAIDEQAYKPNLIVNSGNGIHLYYVFSEPFQFYSYTFIKDRYSPAPSIYVPKESAFSCVSNVQKAISNCYNKGGDYKVDYIQMHQPIRMCGSKTKNTNIRTTGYFVCDKKYELEVFADYFGIPIATSELADKIKADLKAMALVSPESQSISIGRRPLDAKERKIKKIDCLEFDGKFFDYYKENPDAVRKFWLKYCSKYGYSNDKSNKGKLIKKTPKLTSGKYKNYKETLHRIKHGARVGNRQKALHIFCSRARMYYIPEEEVRKDARAIFDFFNIQSPKDKVTEKELESAFSGYTKWIKYSNNRIIELIGIDLSLDNTRDILRYNKRIKKIADREKIIIASEGIIKANPDISYSKLADKLSEMRIKTSKTSLLSIPEIKRLKFAN